MSKALIITSIANDQHPVLQLFAKECRKRDVPFIVIGDTKSPDNFALDGCDFWSVDRQKQLPFSFARLAPVKHYSRKNIGYLIAISNGAKELFETDDDNIPEEGFWQPHERSVDSFHFDNAGWVNVYNYFTEKMIWPRGYPLEELQKEQLSTNNLEKKEVLCPIQQGLANENPDVDAVYRLTYPLPVSFEIANRLALGQNSWSPFNSQNTYWFSEAFPLLYLPSFCSFRMTDIWRSYVAQRISWECGWSILYHEPTVWQERNEHNLMKDFEDEIPGYTNNLNICRELQDLQLQKGIENIGSNMIVCYQKMIDMGVVGKEEMSLLEAWLLDLKTVFKA